MLVGYRVIRRGTLPASGKPEAPGVSEHVPDPSLASPVVGRHDRSHRPPNRS